MKSLCILSLTTLCLAGSARAFSATTGSSTAVSETAKAMGRAFEKSQLQKLNEAGCLLGDSTRPITITADAVGTPAEHRMCVNDNDVAICTKLIHFQRHGQGFHNLMTEMYVELSGLQIDMDDPDVSRNPELRPEVLDPPLTEKGRQQCAARRAQAALLKPQLLVVSPLVRTIQTAKLSFADHPDIPWIAHEGAREQIGFVVCNQRRTRTEAQQEYPEIDFSLLQDDQDTLWDPNVRESALDETDRIYKFLTEFVMGQTEDELAIVGHSVWLFIMCNAVIAMDDEELRSLFQTSEIRSMRVSFYRSNGSEENQE